MTKCSNINCEYHKKFYFQNGNAYAKNTLSQSKISNKISLRELSKLSSNANLSVSVGSVSHSNKNVKAFFKSYVNNKYSIENRAKYYRYIYSKISKIKDISCLNKKNFKKKTKIYNGYTINDIINLEKQIGSSSKYGSIYITSIKNAIGKYPIATKLMALNTSNSIEIYLNKYITNKILKINYLNTLFLHIEHLYVIILLVMFHQL